MAVLSWGAFTKSASSGATDAEPDPGAVALAALAERHEPVIDAIRAYEADRGRPPAELTELVAGYLEALPPEWAGGDPRHTYVVYQELDGSLAWCLEIRLAGDPEGAAEAEEPRFVHCSDAALWDTEGRPVGAWTWYAR